MARIAGEILIGRPVDVVFDYVADSRNEPSFNPAMAGVELLTPLPIGAGTRFRARMGRAGTQMLVELTDFGRPHRRGSRTTSSMMQTSGALTFAADGAGTLMSWDWQVHPKGWMRMLGPLFGSLGGRMERRIWTSMKRYLESTVARPSPSASRRPITAVLLGHARRKGRGPAAWLRRFWSLLHTRHHQDRPLQK
jgi:polyketide cyclase/dehydrase/lipid transport protein